MDAHSHRLQKLRPGDEARLERAVRRRAARLLDLPRRIMRDVHRGIATRPSQCRHCIASKWLAPCDPRIFPSATGDDVSAAIQGWLRLVDVAGIEGRENLVAVVVRQRASIPASVTRPLLPRFLLPRQY